MDKDTIKRLIIEYQQFVANITLKVLHHDE